MEDALKEAKAALVRYGKVLRSEKDLSLDYQPRDRVYLDASDIHTTRPSRKLSHQRLGPFPVFNVVKLTLAPDDPVLGWHLRFPPLPEIIDREKEFIVEEILDSRVINQKLHYLIKWEEYRIEHNSCEPADNVHTLECIMDFHKRHPGAPRHIRFADFNTIPF